MGRPTETQSTYTPQETENPQQFQPPPQPTQPPQYPPPPPPQQPQYPPPSPPLQPQPTQYPPPQQPQYPPPQQPQYPQNNPSYPPPTQQPSQYPQKGTTPYPPPPQQPTPYPPTNNPQQFHHQTSPFPPQTGYAPQPVNFPPPNNQGAAPQQFPPPNSPFNTYDEAAQGIPVQKTYPPTGPMPFYGTNAGTEAWNSGLFDCMDDPTNALTTACFPCLTFGQIAEIIDSGQTSCGTSGLIYGGIALLIWFPCLISCTYRTKLRSKYNLVEAPAPDWATHFLFEWCALCQEYRELRARGWDPELGWMGNIAKSQNMQAEVSMTPPPQQMMG